MGGIAEGLGFLMLLGLLVLTPRGSAAFWLTLPAFVAFAAMHGVYWLVTHPVNKFRGEGVDMAAAGAKFFRVGATDRSGRAPDWTVLRDRWEYSHIIRAVLGLASQTLLIAAIAR